MRRYPSAIDFMEDDEEYQWDEVLEYAHQQAFQWDAFQCVFPGDISEKQISRAPKTDWSKEGF